MSLINYKENNSIYKQVMLTLKNGHVCQLLIHFCVTAEHYEHRMHNIIQNASSLYTLHRFTLIIFTACNLTRLVSHVCIPFQRVASNMFA